VETPGANLVAGMKWLLGTYTGRFNRRHKLFGHLFSGRYKALIVDGSGNGYLKTVCDYVHLNPARAKLIAPKRKLADFRWSSYRAYLLPARKRPAWLRVDRLLGEHGIPKDSSAGRRELALRMEAGRQEQPEQWEHVRRGWCLGDKAFRKELLAQMSERRGPNHYGEERGESDGEKAERIVQAELKRRRWTELDLRKRRKGDKGKVVIAQRLRLETTMTLNWIAQRLSMGAAGSLANLLRGRTVKS
jgi:putative transposase